MRSPNGGAVPFGIVPLATGAQASWGLSLHPCLEGAERKTASLFTVPLALVDQTAYCRHPSSCIHRTRFHQLQSGDEIVIVMGDETGCIEQCQETQSVAAAAMIVVLKPPTVP